MNEKEILNKNISDYQTKLVDNEHKIEQNYHWIVLCSSITQNLRTAQNSGMYQMEILSTLNDNRFQVHV